MIRFLDRPLASRVLLSTPTPLVCVPGFPQLLAVPDDGEPAVLDEAGVPTEETPAPLEAVDPEPLVLIDQLDDSTRRSLWSGPAKRIF